MLFPLYDLFIYNFLLISVSASSFSRFTFDSIIQMPGLLCSLFLT